MSAEQFAGKEHGAVPQPLSSQGHSNRPGTPHVVLRVGSLTCNFSTPPISTPPAQAGLFT
jgi:hypothetical protein